jgi:hypothetical protein
VKAQEEAPYCLACPTHKAIRNYSKTRFNANEIILDELNTTYSSDLGSNHFTRVYASLEPGGVSTNPESGIGYQNLMSCQTATTRSSVWNVIMLEDRRLWVETSIIAAE